MSETHDSLRAKGFVEGPPGYWTKPKRNENLPIMGGLSPAQPEQNPVRALEHRPEARPERKSRLAVVITFIRCGIKELDGDNLQAAFKGMRDAVARSLGVDDRDRRIRWQYQQCVGLGRNGTIVKLDWK